MKKTSLFEKKFKKKLEEDENTVGGGALGPAAAIGHSELTATDWYAPGEYRRQKALGATYSRKGVVSTKRRKKKKKK